MLPTLRLPQAGALTNGLDQGRREDTPQLPMAGAAQLTVIVTFVWGSRQAGWHKPSTSTPMQRKVLFYVRRGLHARCQCACPERHDWPTAAESGR